MKLSDIDTMFDGAAGVRVVANLVLQESGVDPIGLRQINLDIMDNIAPGINNVTEHVRYYTFMAWAAWKATEQAASEGVSAPEVIADLMERYEAFYAWSHMLKGEAFRGSVSLKQTIGRTPDDKPFLFEGKIWDEYKEKRTSIMAPTEYGPSIKALRYLRLAEGVVPTQVMPAVLEFEATISKLIPLHFFAITPPSVFASDIADLATQLCVKKPSEVEQDVFRLMFHTIGSSEKASPEMRRRKATIDYIVAVLKELGPSSEDEIRKRFVMNRVPVGIEGDEEDIAHTAAMLSYLQIRQLQRLATEAMLLWTERVLGEGGVSNPISTEELVRRADEAAAELDPLYAGASTVGDYLASIERSGHSFGWPASAAEEGTEVVDLLKSLRTAQRKDLTRLPGLAARSFAVVKVVNDALSEIELPHSRRRVLDGRPDRLPMELMSKRLDAISARPRASMWTEILEAWVIGQHVHWSAVRGGDGKQRLRIGLEGAGWIGVRKRATSSFVPTPDRLYTMLALSVSSGIIRRVDDGRFAVTDTQPSQERLQ